MAQYPDYYELFARLIQAIQNNGDLFVLCINPASGRPGSDV